MVSKKLPSPLEGKLKGKKGLVVERKYTFHETIDLIGLSKEFAKTKFTLVSLPDVHGIAPFIKGTARQKLRFIFVLCQHFKLVLSLFDIASKWDLLLVRDFLTLPLIVFFPLLLPLRQKVCFINVHNLQRATTRLSHRLAFSLLCKAQIKMAFLESMAGLETIVEEINPKQFFVLPHPVIPVVGRRESKTRDCVGIVGAYRPEKGIDKLIPFLFEIRKRRPVDLVIGTRDYEILRKHIQDVEAVKIIDTTTSDGFVQALSQCDVVLFNYKSLDYFYRGSGVITNAIECGALIVCPDYPVFREQVLSYSPVGAVFKDEKEIVDTVLTVLDRQQALKENLKEYAKRRSLEAIAENIDLFVKANDKRKA